MIFLCFSVLTNLLFIQLPKRHIQKALLDHSHFVYNKLTFALFFMIYSAGIVVLAFVINKIVYPYNSDIVPEFCFNWRFGPGILANGFFFGLTLRTVWKPDFDNLSA